MYRPYINGVIVGIVAIGAMVIVGIIDGIIAIVAGDTCIAPTSWCDHWQHSGTIDGIIAAIAGECDSPLHIDDRDEGSDCR